MLNRISKPLNSAQTTSCFIRRGYRPFFYVYQSDAVGHGIDLNGYFLGARDTFTRSGHRSARTKKANHLEINNTNRIRLFVNVSVGLD